VSLSNLERLCTPIADFLNCLEEIMLADEANAKLNRHSISADEKGGHHIVTA
jgi:hypothetical protein